MGPPGRLVPATEGEMEEVEGEVMDSWISVEDRLPEPANKDAYTFTDRVLVYEAETRDQYVATLWRNKDGKPSGWEITDGKRLMPDEVTHWQPLPEPPTT